MKITLNIKAEKLQSFLDLLGKFDFLTEAGIERVEGTTGSDEIGVKSKQRIKELVEDYFAQTNWPVDKVWLFGSYARNEQEASSDVDLMIRFEEGSKVDLWDFVGIMQDLQDILGCDVDLVREGGAKPFAEDTIERDKLLIYERKTPGQRATGTHP